MANTTTTTASAPATPPTTPAPGGAPARTTAGASPAAPAGRVPSGMRPPPVVDDGGGAGAVSSEGTAPATPETTAAAPPMESKVQARLSALRAQRAEREAASAVHAQELARTRAAAEHESRARAQAEAQAQAERARFERVRGNPFAFLEESGVSPEALIEQAKAESDPVKRLEKQLAAERAEREALAKQIRERHEKEEQDRKAAAARADSEAREREYIRAAKDASRFPTVAAVAEELGEDVVLARTHQLIRDLRKAYQDRGEPIPHIPDHELLGYLDNEWSKKRAARKPAAATTTNPATTASTAPTAGDNRTPITDETASERASMPADVTKMTKAQQKAYYAEIYRKHKKTG